MVKVTLLLPLTFNDGTSIPQEILEGIEEAIYHNFGGWTAAGEVTGAYRMRQTGQKKIEKLNAVLGGP